jgi:leucyl aminopeptidase
MSPRAPRLPSPARRARDTENLLEPTVPRWSVIDDIAGLAGAEDPEPRRRPVLAVGLRSRYADDGTETVEVVGAAASAALRELGLDAAEIVAAHSPSAAPGSVSQVPLAASGSRAASRAVARVLLVGLGRATAADVRTAAAAVGRAARDVRVLVLAFGAGSETALVEGVTLGSWSAPAWRSQGPVRPSGPPERVLVLAGLDIGVDEDRIRRSLARCRATLVARGLGLAPSNIKNPAWMVTQARSVARRAGLSVQVWTEKDLARDGFGGLLAVGSGSASPPRLVRLDYVPRGPERDTRRVVLVGKGITFDTGGLDIKPADGMLAMKTDMLGSAIVLATLAQCRELDVPVRVTGLLALAENHVSGTAFRPSDVITHYGGRTVEVGNTDAEGRLVLADAMAYAVAELAPDVLVDIATLTGAARVALARSMAPIFGTDDAVVEGLRRAGESTGETFWRMPLVDDYREALSSDVADLGNVAPGVGGGAITAALFLRDFAGGLPWAHLDIAGPGRSDVDKGILAKGATGYGARAVLAWLEGLR